MKDMRKKFKIKYYTRYYAYNFNIYSTFDKRKYQEDTFNNWSIFTLEYKCKNV